MLIGDFTISNERKTEVLAEYVDMYIENNGAMPSFREISKNPRISEKEVAYLMRIGIINECRVRKMANDKTGAAFLSRKEKKKRKQKAEAIQNRMAKKDQLKEDFKKLCQEIGHVPTCIEIVGKGFPDRSVLQQFVGPWYNWDEVYQVPFANKAQEIAATKLKLKHRFPQI